ncbi:DUF167 domain-containing protein [Qipengyuania sp. GH25]|mgnify:CR=1 FL=1|uniref:UPF0235 protein K3177_02475 n=1 Tax=Qipengyuania pacifica TaxID=2860199 RepID=A0ABS7JBJ0_9SPHN|nr:DUF167 domain-containing protein [Qipengyuania aerophila]MBX7487372.1 DUF167 domain-containing protein [Qipengyuania aerophila]
MKRLPADLPDADALRALIDEQGRLAVRATPGARSETITITGTGVGVKVRAKPQEGAANTAVIRLVARALDLAPSRVELLRGATSREKLLRIAL